jgi:hypothetical protein
MNFSYIFHKAMIKLENDRKAEDVDMVSATSRYLKKDVTFILIERFESIFLYSPPHSPEVVFLIHCCI